MLRSMTGYGRGEASNRHATVVVELKSANNRFRDVQLRCPREYLALEPRINGILKTPFKRGRIEAHIRRRTRSAGSVVVFDEELAVEYAQAISKLAKRLNVEDANGAHLSLIVGQPGVMGIQDAEPDVLVEWDVLETALQSAVADLLGMREAEGRALYEEFKRLLEQLIIAISAVEEGSVDVNKRLQRKLETRVRALIGERVEPYRIAQEAAMLADKADVVEELSRLKSHCDQFKDALEKEESVGRRLDFLLQEMNREVNTIGSKATEHPTSQQVVQMKSILERMREQAANVE